MNPFLIGGATLLVGAIAYNSVAPVDDFVNNFRFAITDYGVDFANADIKKLIVPAHVTASLMNNTDYEPTVDSMVVTVFTKDAKGNYFELFSSRPAEPFTIRKRTTTNKKITFDMPLKSMGIDLVELGKKAITGKK